MTKESMSLNQNQNRGKELCSIADAKRNVIFKGAFSKQAKVGRGVTCGAESELTLRVVDETITLQARNSGNTSGIQGDHLNYSTKTNNMVPPTLQKMSLKEAPKSFSNNNREPVHEDWRLQIKELDEWRTYKPRTPDKPKLRQNEPDTSPNQLKVGDKVLLDAADPHIVTTTSNEEIPLTVLSIFPFGTVEMSHPKLGTFKANNIRLKPYFDEIDNRNEENKLLKPP
ncbi:hypothetical protein GOBAR_AA31807 [Gossypium barbadense]|uniref:Uncharacterized protein n=1 Tax=Gossypium barbadense TaxID=3634 RepID=A0A2P5WCS1_GOSBA|nr:hypothetical protein GOBAR_AA31807 [Gossypium barbadense]